MLRTVIKVYRYTGRCSFPFLCFFFFFQGVLTPCPLGKESLERKSAFRSMKRNFKNPKQRNGEPNPYHGMELRLG